MCSEEQERKHFEVWIQKWWPQTKGNLDWLDGEYANHFINYAWAGWQARARQESNYSFDEKALESARKIMALVYGQMPPGGSVQLQAKIQVEIIAAMQWAAPERK